MAFTTRTVIAEHENGTTCGLYLEARNLFTWSVADVGINFWARHMTEIWSIMKFNNLNYIPEMTSISQICSVFVFVFCTCLFLPLYYEP